RIAPLTWRRLSTSTDQCIPGKIDAKSIQRTPSGSAIQAHALLPSAFSIEEPTHVRSSEVRLNYDVAADGNVLEPGRMVRCRRNSEVRPATQASLQRRRR